MIPTKSIKDLVGGAGTFVVIGGKRGILTCAHVIEPLIKQKLKYFDVPYSTRLTSDSIIYLPHFDDKSIEDVDLAFIVLNDESCSKVKNSGKEFWDLDLAKEVALKDKVCFLNDNDCNYVTHFIFGVVRSGAKKNPLDEYGRINFTLKNAGTYMVKPDLKKGKDGAGLIYDIENAVCEYRFDATVRRFEVDNIICPKKTQSIMPKSFEGMSGGALWRIYLNICTGESSVELCGVATEQDRSKNPLNLICRGPITLYSSFYPFVIENLAKRDLSINNL
jgi:hypothetical protein